MTTLDALLTSLVLDEEREICFRKFGLDDIQVIIKGRHEGKVGEVDVEFCRDWLTTEEPGALERMIRSAEDQLWAYLHNS